MDFQKTGLLRHDSARAYPGYTIVATFRGLSVKLIDLDGRDVHSWELPGRLGSLAYLLPGGNLLCSVLVESDIPLRTARGGRIIEMDWAGNIVWEFTDPTQHHDFRRLANGNTVYIGWRALSDDHAARIPGGVPGSEAEGRMYEDYFREITPSGKTVWEWSTSRLPLGKYPIADGLDRGEFGHANTVCPISDGMFLVNFRNLDMIAIIDPTQDDFVWSVRNPAWGRPHDPQLVAEGQRILFFANGATDKPKPQRSSVIELDRTTGEETWRWEAGIPWTFYSHVMGGIQRLPNGNTLVCESVFGRLFEIDANDETIVWEYLNPDFSAPFPLARDPANSIFRAYRYAPDSPELRGTPLAADQ